MIWFPFSIYSTSTAIAVPVCDFRQLLLLADVPGSAWNKNEEATD